MRSLAAINPYSLSRLSTGLGIRFLFFIAAYRVPWNDMTTRAQERIEHKKGIEIDA